MRGQKGEVLKVDRGIRGERSTRSRRMQAICGVEYISAWNNSFVESKYQDREREAWWCRWMAAVPAGLRCWTISRQAEGSEQGWRSLTLWKQAMYLQLVEQQVDHEETLKMLKCVVEQDKIVQLVMGIVLSSRNTAE